MSSWLRSSQQELYIENKSSLTASLSQRNLCFLKQDAAHTLQTDQNFKYVIFIDHSKAGEVISMSLMGNMGDTFRHFAITFFHRKKKYCWNSSWMMSQSLQLHHKSQDSYRKQTSWKSNEKKKKKNVQTARWENYMAPCQEEFLLATAERWQTAHVIQVGKQQCIIMPKTHGSWSCGMFKPYIW